MTPLRALDLPPLWLVLFIALAWFQARLVPLGLSLDVAVVQLLAGLLVGAGILLTVLAAIEFRKHRTTIVPHREADRLVQSGIFKRSRNPIYLGDVLILTGAILWMDAVLSLVLVPLFAWVLERRFILPEEDRLRHKFRADWGRYAARVRRWL
jgi:protein-S-isoprenylcysteine O-methyltransferase Ste14